MIENQYVQSIREIRLMVTYDCNGRCRHCLSIQRKHTGCIPAKTAAAIICNLAQQIQLEKVTMFGGEPLLYPDTVEAVCRAAKQAGIQSSLITNGGLWRDADDMQTQAELLLSLAPDEIILAVDTFHMEFIPLIRPYIFAGILKDKGYSGLKLRPLWVKDRGDENIFNQETRECLRTFEHLQIPIDPGLVIQPEGSGQRYIERFYQKGQLNDAFRCGSLAGTQSLSQPASITIQPNGDVTVCNFTIGNIYQNDPETILEEYDPGKDPAMAALISDGLKGLIGYMEEAGIMLNPNEYYSVCGLCSALQRMRRQGAAVVKENERQEWQNKQ